MISIAEMKAEVINKVSIPNYVMEIIVPNMDDYYSGNYPVDFDNSRYMKCCFHDEDTPSLRWYEETNTFYCFGCGKGGPGDRGTVIGMHREFALKLNGTMPTMEEAIIFLYRYFVEKRETTNIVVHTQVEDKINSESELMDLNLMMAETEKAIAVDRSMTLKSRAEIWDKLDEVELFTAMNKVKCNECNAEIRKALRGAEYIR